MFDPDAEIETLRPCSAAFPGHPLRIDPNGGWSVETTLRVLPQLHGLIEYLEDPTSTSTAWRVAQTSPTMPLATNMVPSPSSTSRRRIGWTPCR